MMKEPLSPDALQQLIAGYVLYDLSPEEATQFEQLMANDPAIATEVERMQQALESAYGVSEVAPPPHLAAAVLAASAATTVPTSVAPPPLQRFGW